MFITFTAANKELVYKVHILQGLHHNIILGKDFVRDFQAVINFNDNTINFNTNVMLTPTQKSYLNQVCL